MDRNKNTVDDYRKIVSEGAPHSFVDNNFPLNDVLWWEDANEGGGTASFINDYVTWKRVGTFGKKLWGNEGIIPGDLNQGFIGNCWVIAAIGGIAEHKDRVEKMFVGGNELSDVGIYAIQMYLLGVPYTQIIDDYVPVTPEGETIFAGVGKDDSVWGMLVEKAFAKRYGNYQRTERGWMAAAVASMNGSPWKLYEHIPAQNSPDDIFKLLMTHDVKRDVMTGATISCG